MLHRNIKNMEYTSFTYALVRAHSRVKLLVISDIYQHIYIVCAHKYDGYVYDINNINAKHILY